MSNNEKERIAKIRDLNDHLRKTFTGGTVLLTRGIRTKTPKELCDILEGVKNFNDFNKSNDPWEEADMGSFNYKDDKIIWKIDYYNNDNTYLSPDPSNPDHTHRVMRIMCADEY
ncbi:MAG: DUF3768 domain-containing protein [Alphaproteobacteria bacterium]